MGTDGTNIFTMRSLRSRYEGALREGRPVQNNSTGAVRKGPVPNEKAHPHAGILWFAFASQSYLRTNGVVSLQPLLLAEANSDQLLHFGFQQKVYFEPWSNRDPRPLRTTWFHDGIVRYWEKRDHAKVASHLERRYSPPYDQGFTNAIFEASSFVQAGSGRIPRRLDYWVYCPRPKGQTNTELALLQHHWIEITNIVLDVPKGSFVPLPIEGVARIADERFTAAAGRFIRINYVQTNGWLSDFEAADLLSDPQLQQRLSLLHRALATDASNGGRKGAIQKKALIILGALLLLFPVGLLLFSVASNARKNPPS
jgi:hypothetical protein